MIYKAICLIVIILICAVTVSGEDAVMSSGSAILAQLDWFEGHWAGEFEGTPFAAIYSGPEGGVILSMSKEFGDKERCFVEFEKIQFWKDKVFLTPYPGGEKSVKFDLIDYDSTIQRVHFQNLEHDFPTDLIYERVGDSLIIEVSAARDDSTKSAVYVRLGLE